MSERILDTLGSSFGLDEECINFTKKLFFYVYFFRQKSYFFQGYPFFGT